MSFNDSNELRPAKLVLVIADFAGYTQAFTQHDDLAMAQLTNQFYDLGVEMITRHGGRVVKFMGDACLAVFERDAASEAVHAVLELRQRASTLTAARGIDLTLGARIHSGMVVEGIYGPPGHSQYDVIGAAMNTTVLMGGGHDVRISEVVHQQLDSGFRASWERVDPPTTYRYAAETSGEE